MQRARRSDSDAYNASRGALLRLAACEFSYKCFFMLLYLDAHPQTCYYFDIFVQPTTLGQSPDVQGREGAGRTRLGARMHSWIYIERRSENALPYRGLERRAHRESSGPRTEEPVLIERAMAHDRDAFARLYDRYIDRIFKYIYLLVGEQALAEDLAAQVFARAWQTIGSYPRTERPFPVWLYRLAYNVVNAHWERHRPSSPAIDSPSASDGFFSRAVSRLEEDEKQVILLRFLEGYTVDQIAQITGRSSDTVRTLQYHALVQLSGTSRSP